MRYGSTWKKRVEPTKHIQLCQSNSENLDKHVINHQLRRVLAHFSEHPILPIIFFWVQVMFSFAHAVLRCGSSPMLWKAWHLAADPWEVHPGDPRKKTLNHLENHGTLVLQIASEKVFRPQKTIPKTVSEGVWSCRGMNRNQQWCTYIKVSKRWI